MHPDDLLPGERPQNRPFPFRTLRHGATILPLLLALSACGGGGGGGGGGGNPPTQPPPPTAGVSYSSDASPGAESFSLSSSASGQQLELTLRATGVVNVFGIAFDLVYPASQLTFVSAEELSAFGGGNDTSFQVFQENGRLVVALTRFNPAPGFSGDGDLVRFTFTAGADGSGPVAFEKRQAIRPNGDAIGTLDWIGGSVTVN